MSATQFASGTIGGLRGPGGELDTAAATAAMQPLLDKAEAWAQSDDAPDPANPTSKSAKTLAAEAAADAATINSKLVVVSDRTGYVVSITDLNGNLVAGFSIDDGDLILRDGSSLNDKFAAVYQAISDVGVGASAFATVSDRAGYVISISDDDGNVLIGCSLDDGDLILRDGSSLYERLADLSARIDEAGQGDLEGITDLVLIGDSMTAEGSGYDAEIRAAFPERNVYQLGLGGARDDTIAVRAGVQNLLTIAADGNELPTAGTVACAPNINPLAAASSAKFELYDETGEAIVCYMQTDDDITYTIWPETYPATPIRLPNPARARMISMNVAGNDPSAALALAPLYKKTAILRPGRNSLNFDRYVGDRELDYVQRTAALFARYIVLGPVNGTSAVPIADGGTSTDTEEHAQQFMLNCTDYNCREAATFGKFYGSVLGNYKALGHTTDFTVNGQEFAVLSGDQTVDGTHETESAKAIVVAFLQSILTTLGY